MNGCKYLDIDRFGEVECRKPGKVITCDHCKYGPKSKIKKVKSVKKEGV